MKIAICFYGIFGKTNISRNGRSSQLFEYNLEDYNEMWSINHFKKYVIQNYDVDIFFHTWEIKFFFLLNTSCIFSQLDRLAALAEVASPGSADQSVSSTR